MASALYFVLVISCSVLGVYGNNQMEVNITAKEYCIKETEVTAEIVESYEKDLEKEPTEDYYCYVSCLFAAVGLIDEEGNVDIKEFKAVMPDADLDCLKDVPKIQQCNDMEALDACDLI